MARPTGATALSLQRELRDIKKSEVHRPFVNSFCRIGREERLVVGVWWCVGCGTCTKITPIDETARSAFEIGRGSVRPSGLAAVRRLFSEVRRSPAAG